MASEDDVAEEWPLVVGCQVPRDLIMSITLKKTIIATDLLHNFDIFMSVIKYECDIDMKNQYQTIFYKKLILELQINFRILD